MGNFGENLNLGNRSPPQVTFYLVLGRQGQILEGS